ncbi:MAG: AraC family transcriptional regulator [Polyangiaceae bacterium]
MHDPRSVECTKSTPPPAASALARENAYVQHRVGPGINSWVFDYWNEKPIEKRAVGCGLEIAIQLEGEWNSRGHITGAKVFEPGMILGVTAGERYAHVHKKKGDKAGRQVGFVVFGEMLERLEAENCELRFKNVGARDARFLEFCRLFADRIDHGLPPPEDSALEVEAFIARQFDLCKASSKIRAKKELENHFEFDLPMQLVTDAAGLHPETFCRQFTRDYGISPAIYRVLLRLNHATRLLWSRPDLTVEQIAEESGFRNKSYFHRAYVRQYGRTPKAVRAGFLEALQSVQAS